MDETIKNSVEEQTSTSDFSNDELKEAINNQMRKLQRQSMLLGSQAMCSVILEKIVTTTNKPGKRTMNDYKRLIKDIEDFCRTGLSRKVNTDGETEPVKEDSTMEETVQN